MKRIVIVGGGFAGIFAARRLLARGPEAIQVLLLDRRQAHHYLPLLPDVIGRDIPVEHVTFPLAGAARDGRFRFVHDPVQRVDLASRQVFGEAGQYEFDYLLLSAGSQTNFHGQDELAAVAMTVHSADHAAEVRDSAIAGRHKAYVIAGGGYTGVEAGTNLIRRLRAVGRDARVVLVEPTERLCSTLPGGPGGGESFQDFIEDNCRRLGIETRMRAKVTAGDGEAVVLSDGERIGNAQLIWTAGFTTPQFIRDLDHKQIAGGRLVVDECLRVDDHCFAAGDSAAFVPAGSDKPLRQSVQFSIDMGRRAADNILRLLAGKPPRPFRPVDLGYVVPMANFRGCGRILGIPSRGRVPMLLHYFMSVFRSFGWPNRLGLVRDLLVRR